MLEVKKAAAGSGKTFLLTQEYLKLLLGFINSKKEPQIYYTKRTEKARLEAHRKILAITFTNKATEEMKQRIVKELYILSTGQENPHLETLCKYYNVGKETIEKASAKALSELLFDFSRFNISTIDSFFQTILRTFTREANIGAEYGVELREDSAIKVSTTDLIHSLRKNGSEANRKLHGWLKQYIISKIDSKKSWNIFSDNQDKNRDEESLYSIAQEIGKEEFKTHKKEFLEFLENKNSLKDFKESLDKEIEGCHQNKISNALNFYNRIANSIGEKAIKGAIKNFAVKIYEAQGNYENISFELTDSFINSYNDTEKWLKKGINLDEHTLSILLSSLHNIVEADKYENTCILMGKNLYAIGLLGDISKNLQSYREENDIILISDTNEYLKQIIGQDDTPFIYERVGLSLKHFLIDEFQDTSKLQMANIKPLIMESLAHNHHNLIIGDEKQSIYRFRNADPSLLQTQIFEDFNRFITEDSFKIQKSTNWRSEENIIKFNNTFFLNLIKQIPKESFNTELIKKTYNNVIQSVPSKREPDKGYINITFIENPDKEDITEDNTEWEKVAINSTVKLIHDLIGRGYNASDIAILVNKNYEGAEFINAIIQDNDSNSNKEKLNVISDDSLLLKNSPSINLIISIIEYLDCSNKVNKDFDKDGERHKDVLKILQTYQKLLAQNAMSSSEALMTALKKESEVIPEKELDKMVDDVTLASTSLYTVIETIINNFISKECLSNEAPFIYAFQDVVLEYSKHYTPTIHEFIKWWRVNGGSISITSPANIDAIKVMTIHKSKGLEFPCVIIPFANWNISKFGGLLWLKTPQAVKDTLECNTPPIIPVRYSKKIANTYFSSQFKSITTDMIIDNLNKTYVAMTRAGKELHIFAPQVEVNKNGEKFSSYLKASITYKNDENPDDTINFEKGIVDENHFEYGKPLKGENKEKSNTKDFIEVKEYTPGKSIGDFEFKIPEIENKYDATEEGNLYHSIMSFIKYRENLPYALNKSVSKHLITEGDKEKFKTKISGWLDNPQAKEWFDKKYQVITERPMCLNNKEYRADRIVIDPETNSATVIDYKFGQKHLAKYKKQVSDYMKILELSGYKNVKGFIWYPIDECIEKV